MSEVIKIAVAAVLAAVNRTTTSVQSNVAKGRITVLLSLSAANAFVRYMRWSGRFAMRRYVIRADICAPSNMSLPMGGSKLQPNNSLDPLESAANGMSISSAVFAQLTRMPNTHRHTYHAMCDIYNNKMVKTGQFTTKCKGNKVIALKLQKSLWWDSA